MTHGWNMAIVVPGMDLGDALRFAVYLAAVVWLPGHAIGRLLGLRSAERCERWALAAVLGVVWPSGLYFGLGLMGQQQWYLLPVWLPVVLWGLRGLRGRTASEGNVSGSEPRGDAAWQLVGLLLVAAFIAYYLGRTASCVAYDAGGLRLYGAFYSDKMTNMSPCAALVHDVPPRNLRLAGYTFPYHYFPHLFVAALSRTTGIDVVNGFWFYAAALGIGITGLAVLAFCRQVLGSYRLGCLGLLLFGLLQFTIEARPLDLSIALLLLGLVAIDRGRASGERRSTVLSVGLWAAMPLYEVFHAATALAGLGIWTLAGLRQGRPEACRRAVVTGAAGLGAVVLLQLLCLGQKVVLPTTFVATNAYRDSYKNEWIELLRDSPNAHPVLAEIFYWKRGRADLSSRDEDPAVPRPKPAVWQRLVGTLVFEAGCAGYVFLRYVNLAVFGVLALAAASRKSRVNTAAGRSEPGRAAPIAGRSEPGRAAPITGRHGPARNLVSHPGPDSGKARPWRPSDGIVAAIGLVGFGVPCVVTWGHVAGGQWWETPNLYRATTCAYLLLLLVGTGAIVDMLCRWRRPKHWALIGLIAWQAWGLAVGVTTPATSFHRVDRDRLEALAFLRTAVPYGEVVIHPWIDDLIRDDRAPGKVDWVYKQHFTLGSNLAGQQMYYEGREDHLFIGGFIAAEEVYRRSRLRRKFYRSPDEATVEKVVRQGSVQWVVADEENPAPASIAGKWEPVFRNATVCIYHPSSG